MAEAAQGLGQPKAQQMVAQLLQLHRPPDLGGLRYAGVGRVAQQRESVNNIVGAEWQAVLPANIIAQPNDVLEPVRRNHQLFRQPRHHLAIFVAGEEPFERSGSKCHCRPGSNGRRADSSGGRRRSALLGRRGHASRGLLAMGEATATAVAAAWFCRGGADVVASSINGVGGGREGRTARRLRRNIAAAKTRMKASVRTMNCQRKPRNMACKLRANYRIAPTLHLQIFVRASRWLAQFSNANNAILK